MADWDAVRFFLELARAKTLARAARRLRVDYTTVGRRVSAFERELGAKLFERTPDGFVLTDAGESIRAAAEQMEQSAVAVEQRALGADRRFSGTVRVAAAESAGHSVVLPAMRALHLRHPEIRLHLQTGLARLDIARREADLALRFNPPESGDLRIRRLTSIGFALYASEDYLARHRHGPLHARSVVDSETHRSRVGASSGKRRLGRVPGYLCRLGHGPGHILAHSSISCSTHSSLRDGAQRPL